MIMSIILVGTMGFMFERALHRALELEDARLVLSHASAILRRLDRGVPLSVEDDLQLDKAEWQLTRSDGVLLTRSAGWTSLPDLPWPDPGEHLEHPLAGRTFALHTQGWQHPSGAPQVTLHLALDRSQERELILGLRRVLLGGMAVAALVAAILGRAIAAWGLGPLRAITRQTGKIDYHHLNTRLDVATFPTELQELVITFNAALDRLQVAFNRLNQLGSELAHELRTPLQNLRSEVESLILRPPPGGQVQDALGSVLEECDRMASLIEQILFLARSENPGAAIERRWLDSEVFMAAIAEPYEGIADEKAITIQVTAPAGLRFHADEGLARRAVGNLLGNALRHTPRGGRIILGAHLEGGQAVLWVKDNGEGIPAHILPRLGQPFQRGERDNLLSGRGFGLGLAIVKGIMSLHGGRMQLDSLAGTGTTVFLSFPLPPA